MLAASITYIYTGSLTPSASQVCGHAHDTQTQGTCTPRKQEGRGRRSSRAQRNHPLSALGSPRPQRNSPTHPPPAPLPNPYPRDCLPAHFPSACRMPPAQPAHTGEAAGVGLFSGTPRDPYSSLETLDQTLLHPSRSTRCGFSSSPLQPHHLPSPKPPRAPRECGIQAQIFNLLLKALQI